MGAGGARGVAGCRLSSYRLVLDQVPHLYIFILYCTLTACPVKQWSLCLAPAGGVLLLKLRSMLFSHHKLAVIFIRDWNRVRSSHNFFKFEVSQSRRWPAKFTVEHTLFPARKLNSIGVERIRPADTVQTVLWFGISARTAAA